MQIYRGLANFDGVELSPVAARVLGCLVEKQRTTPDLYPLSVNALVGACNQTTNRWPVVRYDEATVQAGLDELREQELVRREKPHGGRAIKFSQLLPRVVPMAEPELALVAVLLLRGPQTPGELKARTERLHAFADLGSVDAALTRLVDHEDGPFVRLLAREPGRKEARWMELLSAPEDGGVRAAADVGPGDVGPGDVGPDDVAGVTPRGDGAGPASLADRVAELEAEVARLGGLLDGLVRGDRQ